MGGLGAGGGKHLSAPGAFRLCLAGGAVGGVVKLLYQFFKFFAALRAAVLQDRHGLILLRVWRCLRRGRMGARLGARLDGRLGGRLGGRMGGRFLQG